MSAAQAAQIVPSRRPAVRSVASVPAQTSVRSHRALVERRPMSCPPLLLECTAPNTWLVLRRLRSCPVGPRSAKSLGGLRTAASDHAGDHVPHMFICANSWPMELALGDASRALRSRRGGTAVPISAASQQRAQQERRTAEFAPNMHNALRRSANHWTLSVSTRSSEWHAPVRWRRVPGAPASIRVALSVSKACIPHSNGNCKRMTRAS